MADYISQLNGEQMDAALMDVALHNSEAWAVGTRNGYDVEQGDATFHNNAKYYAQVAQSAIPGTYTAAVRWDIAQGLAGEAQEQARANISAGASNRNLLDNPFFTVNQRNATSVNTNGDYIADRWRCTYGSGGYTATRNNDGSITLTPGSASSHATMYQILEQSLVTALNGKTVTASVLMQDGTIRSGTQTFSATGNRTFFAATSASPIQVDWSYSTRGLAIRSYYRAGTIRAVKLELGSYSTLANDVPPDCEEELRKCRFYYRRYANPLSSGIYIMTGMCLNPTTADFMDNEPMYGGNSGTCAYNGSILINGQALTGITLYSRNDGKISQNNLRFTVASGLTANQVAGISCTGGSYIEISHDL